MRIFTAPLLTTFTGPTARDFTVTDNLTNALWSPCGVSRALNVNVTAQVIGRVGYGTLSLDSPFNLTHAVKLAWRRC